MELVHRLTGRQVVDPHGAKVGMVTDVIPDTRTLEPYWVVVTNGLLRKQHHLVPISELYEAAPDSDGDDGQVVVNMDRDTLQHAPRIGADHVLTGEVQEELEQYYGPAA